MEHSGRRATRDNLRALLRLVAEGPRPLAAPVNNRKRTGSLPADGTARRSRASGRSIDPETLLRLEHVIVSHQRLPEWGAPKPPMTPEALIVHYADDLDAKLQMFVCALQEDTAEGALTSKRTILGYQVYRGGV